MADHSKPALASTWANFAAELNSRADDLSFMLDPAFCTPTNLEIGAKRWSATNKRFEQFAGGTTWNALSASYSININGTVGASAPASGAFTTLTTTGDAVFGSFGVTEGTLLSILYGRLATVASHSDPAISVQQNGTGPVVRFSYGAGTNDAVRIDTNGVEIHGKEAASSIATGITPIKQLHGITSTAAYGLFAWGTAAGTYPAVAFSRSNNATLGTHGAVAAGQYLGRLSFEGSDGSAFYQAARIRVDVNGTPTAASVPGRFMFATCAEGGGSATDALSIDSQQRVTALAGIAYLPTVVNPVSGSTVVLTNATSNLINYKSTTTAALTITLPSADLQNGQEVTISTRSAITALTINGGTIYGAPTTLAAGGFCSLIYSSTNLAWYRKG